MVSEPLKYFVDQDPQKIAYVFFELSSSIDCWIDLISFWTMENFQGLYIFKFQQ